MTPKHFHDQLGCVSCKKWWLLSTPIDSDLVVYDHCEWCGKEALVGMIEGRVCRDCLEELVNARFKERHDRDTD
jgi:hypothetical protein